MFNYNNHFLNGLMLDQHGVLSDTEDAAEVNICGECHAMLSKKKIP